MPHAGIHVEVTGTGPHPVVLLHGFSDNLSTWRRVVPALAVRHRVIAIDLPGHGRSTRPWSRPLIAGYVEAVAQVLDAHDVQAPVSIVGNSMGAVVATCFATRYPERTDRLVLIGMPGMTGVPRIWRAALSRPASIALRTALAPIPQAQLQRGFGWVYARAASPHPAAIDAQALWGFSTPYADRSRVHGLTDLGRALLADLAVLHLDRALAALGVPILQILGRHDRLVPPRPANARSDAVVLRGCGHCPQLDAPDRLLGVVLPFLAAGEPSVGAAGERPGDRTRAARS